MTEPTDFMDSRLLLTYLDGELDGPQEEVLFRLLSEDDALRAEMQDHLAIRTAVQHDAQAFAPPAAATAAIFGSLGFSIPSTVVADESGSTWFAAGSAVVAVVVSMLLTMLIVGNEKQLVLETNAPEVPPATTYSSETISPQDISAAHPTRMNREIISKSAVVRRETQSEDVMNTGKSVQQNTAELFPITPVTQYIEKDLRGIRAPYIPYVSFLRPPAHSIVFYFRNTSAQSAPSNTMAPASSMLAANLNIGALYPLSLHHAIGIELGREVFPQSFSGSLRGASVRYEQSPSVYCATAVYQITAGEVLPLVYPYVQIQAGAAFRLGPLARTNIGVQVKPHNRISMMIGAEGSILAYKFQNTWFDTKKLGLTYGVRYEF